MKCNECKCATPIGYYAMLNKGTLLCSKLGIYVDASNFCIADQLRTEVLNGLPEVHNNRQPYVQRRNHKV